jgi:pyruvate-formate lyase-activating enzyme
MTDKWLQGAPSLVVANEAGEVFDIPGLAMAGRTGDEFVLPEQNEMIPMPQGSELYHLFDRVAVGFDRETGEMQVVDTYEGEKVMPVAVFQAPAYTLFYIAGFMREPDAQPLPLFIYGAVGWKDDGFVISGRRVDDDIRQDADQFDQDELERRAEKILQEFPQNRLAEHLVQNCYRRYWCPAARNFIMGRWEMPLPTSMTCNSRCAGCISIRMKNRPRPPQDRIAFVPNVDEIVEITVPHLQRAERAIASFGQGCEGEPLMNPELLERSIRRIREVSQRGTINLNTNGSKPDVVAHLFDAGLDSIRVSMNSVVPDVYSAYFNPIDYSYDNIIETLRVAKDKEKFSSINYFVFPGVTDRAEEFETLCRLIENVDLKMIQWRNLNIDADDYLALLGDTITKDKEAPLGIKTILDTLSKEYPNLRHGYFNPALR